MKSILVTGGAGYIGSHACKALAAAGYFPVSYDNLVSGHEWAVRWGPLEIGDIADRERLDAVLTRYRPAAVLHFAAFAYVGESVQDPGKYYRNNVAGSLTLLEAMRDHGIRQMVFSSTCATYGFPQTLPILESQLQQPINPYGASKLMIERMLADFSAAHGLRAVSLRYFNAAGADPDAVIGELHEPETHLIPLALKAAETSKQLTVFGTDYPTPDGTCIRDYTHVSDLADAHVCALQLLESGAASASFNLGTGRGWSVSEVIRQVTTYTGKELAVYHGPRREGDPPELVAGVDRARVILGWQARFGLAEIIRDAWSWEQRLRNGMPTRTATDCTVR